MKKTALPSAFRFHITSSFQSLFAFKKNRLFLKLCALAFMTSTAASPAFADGLVENVNGITLDNDGRVIRFNAMLVGRDGKVTQLLTKKDNLPKQLDFRLDGRGATLLPGLIDAHGHVMGLGFQLLTLDLSATNSLAEAQAICRKISRTWLDYWSRLEPRKMGAWAVPDSARP
jgi:predicted amidohydrolase YtcJ